MPFSGLFTFFDTPSDRPVGGSSGKRVIVPSEYGIPALETLKGMAVNFDSLLMSKHVVQYKIGIIEDYSIGERMEDGSLPIYVSGFIYAHDFPQEAADIKENQEDLGFSYETIDTPVNPGIWNGESVLVVCGPMVFSGGAILLKAKGAYTKTSLAAEAEGVEDLSIEEIIAAVIAAMESKYDLAIKAQQCAMQEMQSQMIEDHMEAENALASAHMESEAKMAELCAEGEEGEKEVEVKEPVVTEEVAEEVVEPVAEVVVEEPAAEEVVEEPAAEAPVEEPVEEPAAEVVDFKAMAEDLEGQVAALKAELETMKADLKAEADAKFQHEHKGFAHPTTLAQKYNFKAEAESYEAQLAAIDARKDLGVGERMALKFELRNAHMKK